MSGRAAFPLFYASPGKGRGSPRLGRSKVLGRRNSPFVAAAIRIPERMNAQLSLVLPTASPRLYVHEGARQSLERKLMAAFPGPVAVSITDNRQAIITHRMQDGILRVRVHHMFLDSPAHVVDALVRYITRGDRDASATVGDYIDSNGQRLAPRNRKIQLSTRGKHHDLLSILDDVNERYFGGSTSPLITWGKRGTSKHKKRATIKLGSYSASERLVRVHPALDRPWVPRYFIAYIVYHEVLHHVIPASRGIGRTLLHPPEFRERERQFRNYERSMQWERRHIGRLLRM